MEKIILDGEKNRSNTIHLCVRDDHVRALLGSSGKCCLRD